MIHQDRARAGSFGADAERYDRTRPRYPDAMVDDLVAGGTPAVLDVGCGTGIVATAFTARGCAVLGVEPDPRMAAVAERKGIAVETATFEEWDAAGRTFDLVVSGQAWHWVDPERGPAKAAEVLRPGGRFAVFWNLGGPDRATHALLDEVYRRHAPELLNGSVALGKLEDRRESDAAAIRATGRFAEPEVRTYEWTQRHTTAEWVDQLPTHSDHALLPDATRAALLADITATLDTAGGGLTLHYRTLVITATTIRG